MEKGNRDSRLHRGGSLGSALSRWLGSLRLQLSDQVRDSDRGDVPGWVLITVMTAGMVTALWVLAEPQLKSFLQSALNAVHGP